MKVDKKKCIRWAGELVTIPQPRLRHPNWCQPRFTLTVYQMAIPLANKNYCKNFWVARLGRDTIDLSPAIFSGAAAQQPRKNHPLANSFLVPLATYKDAGERRGGNRRGRDTESDGATFFGEVQMPKETNYFDSSAYFDSTFFDPEAPFEPEREAPPQSRRQTQGSSCGKLCPPR